MNQRGFATLEVILMVVIIGILATVAVPRFTDVTTKANTAKIQSDLTTIDTAIQIYYMETGTNPSDIDTLVSKGYLMDTPKPPTGSAFINGDSTEISKLTNSTKYTIGDKSTGSDTGSKTFKRAMLGDKVAGDFSTTTTNN